MKVCAIHIADKEEFHAKKILGSFHISKPDEIDAVQFFWYCCPCGCGSIAPLSVGNNFKPVDGPSWKWNGSLEAATLEPSVNHVNHWHGWLEQGFWTDKKSEA